MSLAVPDSTVAVRYEPIQAEVYGMRKVFIMSEVQMNFCIVIVAFTLACIVPCHALSFT